MARPSKLTPELLQSAEGYLDTCTDEIHETDKSALAFVKVNLPTIEGFAIYLGIHKDTVQDWCKGSESDTYEEQQMKKEFSVLVKGILQEQGKRLINNALGGLYQAKIAGMMLSKHGYVEKKEISGNDGAPLTIELINYADETTPPVSSETVPASLS